MATRNVYLVRRCPVCWQKVFPSSTQMIAGHWDSTGRAVCPASDDLPYGTAIVGPRRPTAKAAA